MKELPLAFSASVSLSSLAKVPSVGYTKACKPSVEYAGFVLTDCLS